MLMNSMNTEYRTTDLTNEHFSAQNKRNKKNFQIFFYHKIVFILTKFSVSVCVHIIKCLWSGWGENNVHKNPITSMAHIS